MATSFLLAVHTRTAAVRAAAKGESEPPHARAPALPTDSPLPPRAARRSLCFFHCSGRIRVQRCEAASVAAILREADDFVQRQVGGAPYSLLCASTMQPIDACRALAVEDEMLLVVLRGKSFHLSPLTEGNITSQLPLPRYASTWMDVPFEPIELADYKDQVMPDGSPPPIPQKLYQMAFKMRQGDPAARAFEDPGKPFSVDSIRCDEYGRLRRAAAELLDGDSVIVEQESKVRQTIDELQEKPLHEQIMELASNGELPHPAEKRHSGRRDSAGMCGFTEEECLMLLEVDKRPWDEDADKVLTMLRARG